MNEALCRRLGVLYRRKHTLLDLVEKAGRRLCERLWGVDCRIFEKTIRLNREVHMRAFGQPDLSGCNGVACYP